MFSKSENYFKQFQVREFAFSPFLASIFYYKEGHDPDLGYQLFMKRATSKFFVVALEPKTRHPGNFTTFFISVLVNLEFAI